MGKSNLMDRYDIKFAFHESEIPAFLAQLSEDWLILEINGHRIHPYENLYLDTPDLLSYHEHHNTRRKRVKYRWRTYINSDDRFLEVKVKTNTNKTLKVRMPSQGHQLKLNEIEKQWIDHQYGPQSDKLSAVLFTRYQRISLINSNQDRLTIDLNLSSENLKNKTKIDFAPLCIAELKQVQYHVSSPVFAAFRQMGIRPLRISKYCLGMIYSDPSVKQNQFKSKRLKVDKIRKSRIPN